MLTRKQAQHLEDLDNYGFSDDEDEFYEEYEEGDDYDSSSMKPSNIPSGPVSAADLWAEDDEEVNEKSQPLTAIRDSGLKPNPTSSLPPVGGFDNAIMLVNVYKQDPKDDFVSEDFNEDGSSSSTTAEGIQMSQMNNEGFVNVTSAEAPRFHSAPRAIKGNVVLEVHKWSLIYQLPDFLLEQVAGYLSPVNILQLRETCHRIKKAIDSPAVWAEKVREAEDAGAKLRPPLFTSPMKGLLNEIPPGTAYPPQERYATPSIKNAVPLASPVVLHPPCHQQGEDRVVRAMEIVDGFLFRASSVLTLSDLRGGASSSILWDAGSIVADDAITHLHRIPGFTHVLVGTAGGTVGLASVSRPRSHSSRTIEGVFTVFGNIHDDTKPSAPPGIWKLRSAVVSSDPASQWILVIAGSATVMKAWRLEIVPSSMSSMDPPTWSQICAWSLESASTPSRFGAWDITSAGKLLLSVARKGAGGPDLHWWDLTQGDGMPTTWRPSALYDKAPPFIVKWWNREDMKVYDMNTDKNPVPNLVTANPISWLAWVVFEPKTGNFVLGAQGARKLGGRPAIVIVDPVEETVVAMEPLRTIRTVFPRPVTPDACPVAVCYPYIFFTSTSPFKIKKSNNSQTGMQVFNLRAHANGITAAAHSVGSTTRLPWVTLHSSVWAFPWPNENLPASWKAKEESIRSIKVLGDTSMVVVETNLAVHVWDQRTQPASERAELEPYHNRRMHTWAGALDVGIEECTQQVPSHLEPRITAFAVDPDRLWQSYVGTWSGLVAPSAYSLRTANRTASRRRSLW